MNKYNIFSLDKIKYIQRHNSQINMESACHLKFSIYSHCHLSIKHMVQSRFKDLLRPLNWCVKRDFLMLTSYSSPLNFQILFIIFCKYLEKNQIRLTLFNLLYSLLAIKFIRCLNFL